MGLKITKDHMAARLDGDPEDLEDKDKLTLMKKEYKLAIQTHPDYVAAKQEITKYLINLPKSISHNTADLSKINRLYAEAQSYSSRITTLEVAALENTLRWQRLLNLIDAYIEDRKSELLVSENIIDMSIPKAEAKIRNILKKEHRTRTKFKDELTQAQGFQRMVEIKKKDMGQVITTLGKQVKALSLENSLR